MALPSSRRVGNGKRLLVDAGGRGRAGARGLGTVYTGDHVDTDANHVGGVRAFGRIEILAIDSQRTFRVRHRRIADAFELRARGAIFGLPVDAIADHTTATG